MNLTRHSQTTVKIIHMALFMLPALLVTPSQPALAAGVDNGQQLYLTHCAGCHGIDGISAIPEAKNFSRANFLAQPDQDLIDIISSGRNTMPAYLGILNDREILDIINYLRRMLN